MPKEISYTIDPADVHWTMKWRKADGTKDPMFADKPDTEEVYEEPGMLAVLIANNLIHMNAPWWEKSWPEDAKRGFYVGLNMNDVFAWGCADSEEIKFDELKDVYMHFEKNPEWGPVIWASKKRRQLPQRPVIDMMVKDGVDIEALTKEIEELKRNDAGAKGSDVCGITEPRGSVGPSAPDHPEQQPDGAVAQDHVGAGGAS